MLYFVPLLVCQGINTAEFDTAEFEVVKSRPTLQKERKEQREQEEKLAAQKAMAEAAAARKAVQQAARDQLKAQRELKRTEAQARFFRLCCGYPKIISSVIVVVCLPQQPLQVYVNHFCFVL